MGLDHYPLPAAGADPSPSPHSTTLRLRPSLRVLWDCPFEKLGRRWVQHFCCCIHGDAPLGTPSPTPGRSPQVPPATGGIYHPPSTPAALGVEGRVPSSFGRSGCNPIRGTAHVAPLHCSPGHLTRFLCHHEAPRCWSPTPALLQHHPSAAGAGFTPHLTAPPILSAHTTGSPTALGLPRRPNSPSLSTEKGRSVLNKQGITVGWLADSPR